MPRSSRGSRTYATPIRPRSPSNGSSGSVRDLITTDVATHPEKATAALAYSVGVEDPAFSFGAMEPREVSLKIHAAWRSLFSSLASRAPVVAVIDDIHWADQVLLDLLEELADRVIGPVFLPVSGATRA